MRRRPIAARLFAPNTIATKENSFATLSPLERTDNCNHFVLFSNSICSPLVKPDHTAMCEKRMLYTE